MKKIVILKHGGGELANQLWNYVSIYAHALESGAEIVNPSFYEHHSSFNFLSEESALTTFFASWFKNSAGRRTGLRNRFWRATYAGYVQLMHVLHNSSIISSENEGNRVVYLPPTSPLPEATKIVTGYFEGWLFRNPVGLKKFRNELVNIFTPAKDIENRVTEIIVPFREQYERIIGIHLRQADYQEFKGGAYYISQTRAKEIIDDYLLKNEFDKNKTLFLITSDGPVDTSIFRNLNTYISKENAITDLFLLSSTDAIIGSDSSFGAFASWYGNIPHLVMTKNPIDWGYYSDKKSYFENKYSKMVQY